MNNRDITVLENELEVTSVFSSDKVSKSLSREAVGSIPTKKFDELWSSIKFLDVNEKKEHSLSDQDFIKGGYLASESWNKVETFQSRIVNVGPNTVTCECVVDKESRDFATRTFNIELFSHLGELTPKMPVLLTFKEKPGAARMDVYSGKGIVDMEIFNLNDLYDGLENSALNKPFKI